MPNRGLRLTSGVVALLFCANSARPDPVGTQAPESLKALIGELHAAIVREDADRFQAQLRGDSAEVRSGAEYVGWLSERARPFGSLESIDVLGYWHDPRLAVLDLKFGRKASILATLVLDARTPRRIVELDFSAPMPQTYSLAATFKAMLRARPDVSISYCVARHSKNQAVTMRGSSRDEVHPIASLNKLVILLALQGALKEGKVRLADTLAVRDRDPVRGSGVVQYWPNSVPVTVHALAALAMGELSDNLASDMLLRHLGRAGVEKSLMGAIGTDEPDRSIRPFLSHSEALYLNWAPAAADKLAERYLAADVDERRTILAGPIERALPEFDYRKARNTARDLDRLGWCMSPKQVASIGDAILRADGWNTAGPGLSLLSIGCRETPLAARALDYGGFKSGRFPGIRAMFVMVRTRWKEWWSICVVVRCDEESLGRADLPPALERAILLMLCEVLQD